MAPQNARGMTLIDVVVGTAIVLVVFVALYGLLRFSIALSNLATNTMTASALASDRMESLRALPYESLSVGEDGATTTENGIPYGVHTSITEVGDADYKRVVVSVFYLPSIGPRTVSLATYIASTTPLLVSP